MLGVRFNQVAWCPWCQCNKREKMSTGSSLKSAGDRFKAFDLRLRAACVIKPVAPVIQGLGY